METETSKQKNIGKSMFRPLQKKRFSDQIADLIQKRILEDNLEVGTNLPSGKSDGRRVSGQPLRDQGSLADIGDIRSCQYQKRAHRRDFCLQCLSCAHQKIA